jgi:hypothetical protein
MRSKRNYVAALLAAATAAIAMAAGPTAAALSANVAQPNVTVPAAARSHQSHDVSHSAVDSLWHAMKYAQNQHISTTTYMAAAHLAPR